MKAQFIVTVEGDWLHNGQRITSARAEKYVREAVKDKFEFLANRATVKRMPAPSQPAAPEGWALVPIRPTKEQKQVGGEVAGWDIAAYVYECMVNAAPAAPVTKGENT